MVSKNNVLPNAHYMKGTFRHTKTWFNQAARHKRRRLARQEKAAAVFPRPTAGLLRPAVHPPTQRYNYKVRLGRGFSLAELMQAGVSAKKARTIGVAVDKRRKNKSTESVTENVNRLKTYMSKLVVFPKSGKPKQGDSDKSKLKSVAQNTHKEIIPLVKKIKVKARAITKKASEESSAYATLRAARVNKKLNAKRLKKLEAGKKSE